MYMGTFDLLVFQVILGGAVSSKCVWYIAVKTVPEFENKKVCTKYSTMVRGQKYRVPGVQLLELMSMPKFLVQQWQY